MEFFDGDGSREATIDTLPAAVYIFGTDKRLKKINRAAEALEQAERTFLAGRRYELQINSLIL